MPPQCTIYLEPYSQEHGELAPASPKERRRLEMAAMSRPSETVPQLSIISGFSSPPPLCVFVYLSGFLRYWRLNPRAHTC